MPFDSNAAPFLAEYAARKRLAELGYRFDICDLDCVTGEAFLLIGNEFDRLANKKRKDSKAKSSRKGSVRRRR